MEIHKILSKLEEFNIETITETGIPSYIQTHKMIKPRYELVSYPRPEGKPI